MSIKCYDFIEQDPNNRFSIASVNKINRLTYLSEFQNLNLNEYQADVNLLVLYANLDYVRSMSENEHLKKNLLKLNLVNNTEYFQLPFIFRTVYNRLFKLKPHLQKYFDDFRAIAKPNLNAKLFCVQIRIGGARPNVDEDIVFLQHEKTKLFWNFIKNTFIRDESNYKIFITSDTESVVNEGLQEFGYDKVVYINGMYTHIDKGPASKNCHQHFKTILDLHAFQLCDKVLVGRGEYGLMGNYLRNYPFDDFYRYSEIVSNNSIREHQFVQVKDLKDWKNSINSLF